MKNRFDPYTFLTHAIFHCLYGSGPVDREPTQGDHEAVGILTAARSAWMRETIRFDIVPTAEFSKWERAQRKGGEHLGR